VGVDIDRADATTADFDRTARGGVSVRGLAVRPAVARDKFDVRHSAILRPPDE
jgi:hypothetical protein